MNENYDVEEQNKSSPPPPPHAFLSDLELIPYTSINISQIVFWRASLEKQSRSAFLSMQVMCIWDSWDVLK